MKKNDAMTKGLVDIINPIVLKIMKISFFLLLVCTFSVNAAGYSQTRISINAKEASIRNVLREIESKSDYTFFYNEDFLDLNKTVTYTAENESVVNVLGNIADKTGLDFKVLENNLVVITRGDENNQKVVTGTVTDENGISMPGVSVQVEGTAIGAVTDINGKYNIELPGESGVLIFTFIGFTSLKISVKGGAIVNVKMIMEAQNLNQVVVVGYGTQKVGSVTGSIGKISGKDISTIPVASATQSMQGRVSGVSVTNNGGAPGSAPIVQIRGVGSINYNSDPLYVVDGIPVNSIHSIAPGDIESFDILKDASATAIYGSRGSNGVVIITTKKGSTNDKFTIEYDGYYGVQKAWKQLEFLNHDEYLKYGTDLLQNAALALPVRWSEAEMNKPIYTGASTTFKQTETDWQDAMFQTAAIQQHSVSLTGGSAKSKFFSSINYFSQDGTMVGTKYDRLNFRLNSTHEISKRLNFGETFSIYNGTNQGEKLSGNRPQIMHMIRAVPYMPIYDPTLDGGYRGPDGIDGTDYENPVRIALQPTSTYYSFKLLGSAFAEYKFTDWLKFKSTVGLEYTSDRRYNITPTFKDGTYHANTKEALEDYRYTSTSWLFTNQLGADKTFGKHYISGVLVAEQQRVESYGLDAGGNLPDNTVQQLSNPTDVYVSGGKSEEALISYIGRVQYSYANKYLLSASYRADGSSKFAPGNKWGYFPSLSAGWRVKEESFLKDVKAISDLKLRASYGETGFNGIGNYVWQANENVGGAFYMLGSARSQASYFDKLGNLDLKWETTNMFNFGVDMKFLNNALSVSAEYYDRKTENLILYVQPAASLGYSQGTSTNIGSMSNKGFEFQLGYNKQIGEVLLNVTGNLSTNKNEVLKLDLPTSVIYAGANGDFGGDAITMTKEGEPIQQFYGYRVDHIIQTDEDHPTMPNAKPGDILFKDLSGADGVPDGKIDAYDREVLGSYLPKFQYGFNLALNWKGFDFSAFFQGSYGNDIFNANKITMEGMARLFNAGKGVLDAWTPTNTNTTMPRAVSGDPNKNARVSDRWLEDGSYLRLKTLTIGYTLPSDMLKTVSKGTISRIRVYVSTQNLLTFTKYTGYDPEIGRRSGLDNANLINGIDYGQFPSPRVVLGGLQVSF